MTPHVYPAGRYKICPRIKRTMLSLCVIAKNEAHCIGDMLKSVQTLNGEAIVLDTGSSDDTRAVALSYGARVYRYEWKNDFADARNVSMSYARHPWILVLDADEELAPSSLELIQNLIQGGPKAYFLNRHHFCATPNAATFSILEEGHPAIARGAKLYFSTHDIRLFPNDSRIQFAGEVHESVEDSLRHLGYAIERTPGIIYHYGHLLSGKRAQEKAALYLNLAKEKVLAAPHDWRAWYHLGVELQHHSRHLEAMHAFSRGIKMCSDFAPLWRQMGVSLSEQGDYSSALEAFTEALAKDHVCPLTWNALGVTFMRVNSLDAAEKCFETILAGDRVNPLAIMNLELVRQIKESTPS
jgi:tetratricopeptide (TPR) repeat protein